MASLNASAMMSASFGREVRRVRRDPMTIAIEASLRDMKEAEERQQKQEAESIKTPDKSSSDAKSSSKAEIKTEQKGTPSVVEKTKKKDSLHAKPSEVTVKEEVTSPTFEGLSELDIRTKLIESAKIRSKISRQSSDEKLKKKARRSQADEKPQKSLSGKTLLTC